MPRDRNKCLHASASCTVRQEAISPGGDLGETHRQVGDLGPGGGRDCEAPCWGALPSTLQREGQEQLWDYEQEYEYVYAGIQRHVLDLPPSLTL